MACGKPFRKPNWLVARRRSTRAIVVSLRTLLLLGLCYLFLFPIFYLILSAVSAPEAMADPNVVWLPDQLTLANFKTAVVELEFSRSALLSLCNTLLGTIASLVSCSLIGYGFARFQFAEKKVLFAIVILNIIVPPQTMLISQYLQFRYFDFGGILGVLEPILNFSSVDLLNTPWVFLLPAMLGVGLRDGLFIFIFRQFFLGIPKDLEEAARVDGSNALRTFVRIIVPVAVPAFITVLLFSFVWHWNDFYTSDMMFASGTKPLIPQLAIVKTELANMMNRGGNDALNARGVLASAALLAITVPLALYTVTQRYFVESIERVGMVG